MVWSIALSRWKVFRSVNLSLSAGKVNKKIRVTHIFSADDNSVTPLLPRRAMPPQLMWADDERGIPRRIARTRTVAACAGDASRACCYHGQPMGPRVGTGAAICGSLPRAAARACGNQSAVVGCRACDAGAAEVQSFAARDSR